MSKGDLSFPVANSVFIGASVFTQWQIALARPVITPGRPSISGLWNLDGKRLQSVIANSPPLLWRWPRQCHSESFDFPEPSDQQTKQAVDGYLWGGRRRPTVRCKF